MGMAMTKIADMHFKVIRSRPYLAGAAHTLIVYRHDKDGKPYLYHAESFYGEDGRKTRSDAIRRGRMFQHRFDRLRTTYIRVADRREFEKLGIRMEA
jgi:hypothetical protein